jgi:hypothetical protein
VKNLIVDFDVPPYLCMQGTEVGPICSLAVPLTLLTSSDNCPPILTLCKQPTSNSLTHATTLESTPKIAIFISSLSYKTYVFEDKFLHPLHVLLVDKYSKSSAFLA